ncbi:10688_t:CDS:10 [Funneliformis caledonium]|uniref:Actin cytoskeleton-regulatory complex protein SLA1 n=1 Tax=Funneliformis caledonium TaxID=1117310 RepID=A0A9N9D6N7_9GLOM|nr:10688_t:CDS:10 [Funneliformis caledonium]
MPLNYVSICIALYDYTAQTDDELSFHEDDVLYILENDEEDWWKAKLKSANTEGEHLIGLVPRNYIQEAECTAVLRALWDFEASSEEEISFKEDDMLNLYEEAEDGWFLVKFNDVFGMIPPNYVEKTNKAKPVSLFDALSSANNTYVDPLKLYAVKAARPKAGSSVNESKTWSVTELVGDKKKQKKKGTLAIGNGKVIFASESDKAPVRQWEINDITDINKDKKNISFIFGGSKGGTIDFHANKNIIMEIFQKAEDCRASIEIPTVKVDNASIRSSIVSPTSTSSSRPSSTHKSIVYEEPQGYENDEQDISNSYNNVPEITVEENDVEENEFLSPKFGVALYDFDAQGDDEVSIREGDELWVIDDVSSEEWWKIKKGDEEGVVPASFIEAKDNEAEMAAQVAAAEAAAEAERQQFEKEERIKREEERRRRQRDDEERKRREAEKRVLEEKKRKEAQSQLAPPPPILPNRPIRANPSLEEAAVKKILTPANRALPERPAQAQSKSKPIPSNTRTWTDRTGSFKVEAQFLELIDGKVHLHKLNGVKIAVPVDKMSKEDLAYLEEVTGEKVYDKNDDTPLAAIAAAYKGKARLSNNYAIDYDWYDFFLHADVSHEDAFEYAKKFLAEKMDESSIPDLNRDVMKGLGIKEGDIIRIKKYIDQRYNFGKKRNVSFGSTSVIPDDIDIQSKSKQSARKSQPEDIQKAQQLLEFDMKIQLKRDEQLARELQEEENRIARSEGRQIPKAADLYSNLDSIIQKEEKKTLTTTPQLFAANNGVLKNNTKKARPQPTKAASIQIDATTLANSKGSFDDAFKSSSTTSTESKFDDDAWVSKDLTPPLVPTVKTSTPPVNQNQISLHLPSTIPSSNTMGQLSWHSNNMNFQPSQPNQVHAPTPPPVPPPPPSQSIVPLNSLLHQPLIPAKPASLNTNNNIQGNNMMNIQRSNSTGSFQGMGTGNLSGPVVSNFNSSINTWSSASLTTSTLTNSTSGYNLSNNVFASMKNGQFGPIAPSSNFNANVSQDKYSALKQVDPNAPSVFSNSNSSNGLGFGQKQGGFINSNQTNWSQNNLGFPQQTSNFGMSGQNSGFGGQPNQMGLNPQVFNPNQGVNINPGTNQGFVPNQNFNINQQHPGRQW